MSIGFIKLHRKITEWEWYSDNNVFRVFTHLLLTANFENKKWQGIDISRGQVITSLQKLGKSTSLTIQQVRTALTKLKSTHEITIKSTKLHTFITLTNYNIYQDKLIENNTLDNTPDNNSATKEQQRSNKGATTTKEGKKAKKVKEEKEIEFPEFIDRELWNSYVVMRIEKKKPLTGEAVRLTMRDLHKFEAKQKGFANIALENSIKGSWQGVFEPKDGQTSTRIDSLAARLNQIVKADYFQSVTLGNPVKITCLPKMSTKVHSLPIEIRTLIKAEFKQPIEII